MFVIENTADFLLSQDSERNALTINYSQYDVIFADISPDSEAIEMPDEFFALPSYLLPKGKEVFTLKVDGTSMINAGILDGDVVIVERQNTARNGEIVVAMTDENEVTLKTFYKEKGHFRLQPENDTMEPIILENVTILGKAIGLYRKI